MDEEKLKKHNWLNNKLNTEALLSYKDAKRDVIKEIRNSRARYYHNEFNINKNNSRNTWNIINDLTKGDIKQNTSHINEFNAGNLMNTSLRLV